MLIIQTTRGCSFACTYCVERNNYYARKFRKSSEALKAEIDYIGWKTKNVREAGGCNDLHIADSCFGMYKEDIETAQFVVDADNRYS